MVLKQKKPLEKDIQKQLFEWLLVHGFRVWRQNSGAVTAEYKGKMRFVRFNSQPGLSDIGGWVPPRLSGATHSIPLYVEVKRPGGKLSDDQARFLAKVNADNGIGLVARSIEELVAGLKERGIAIQERVIRCPDLLEYRDISTPMK